MRNSEIRTRPIGGSQLLIRFIPCGDRLGHAISVISEAGSPVALLKSVEGTADEHWPASPPLQTLSLHELPDGRQAALLVGMAGASHWSATIEPAADSASLVFDIACRHSQPPSWLGSRYQRLAAAANVLVEGLDGAVVSDQQDCVSVVPEETAGQRGTSRWKYVVRLVQ